MSKRFKCVNSSEGVPQNWCDAVSKSALYISNFWHNLDGVVKTGLETDVFEVQDNLLKAKLSQAVHANKHQRLTFPFVVSSPVQLSTLHRQKEYKAKGEKCVAKFMGDFTLPHLFPWESDGFRWIPSDSDGTFFWHGTEHCLLVQLDFFPMGFVQNTSDSIGIMHRTLLESDGVGCV